MDEYYYNCNVFLSYRYAIAVHDDDVNALWPYIRYKLSLKDFILLQLLIAMILIHFTVDSKNWCSSICIRILSVSKKMLGSKVW